MLLYIVGYLVGTGWNGTLLNPDQNPSLFGQNPIILKWLYLFLIINIWGEKFSGELFINIE